jgi:hypothetical protein
MITYEVKWKRLRGWRWNRLRSVKGDGFVWTSAEDAGKGILGMQNTRYFILQDETKIEIPASDTVFVFSKERYQRVIENMQNDIGQAVPVNPR